jgi:hypothetical protein
LCCEFGSRLHGIFLRFLALGCLTWFPLALNTGNRYWGTVLRSGSSRKCLGHESFGHVDFGTAGTY